MFTELALRLSQLLVAGLVVILLALMMKTSGLKHHSLILWYGAICGGGAFIIGIIGIVSVFVPKLQRVVMLVLDASTGFSVLAGAIAFVAIVKTGHCTDNVYVSRLKRLIEISMEKPVSFAGNEKAWGDSVYVRCRDAQALTVLLWILFITFLGCVALNLLRSNKRSSANRNSV